MNTSRKATQGMHFSIAARVDAFIYIKKNYDEAGAFWREMEKRRGVIKSDARCSSSSIKSGAESKRARPRCGIHLSATEIALDRVTLSRATGLGRCTCLQPRSHSPSPPLHSHAFSVLALHPHPTLLDALDCVQPTTHSRIFAIALTASIRSHPLPRTGRAEMHWAWLPPPLGR